MIRRARKMAAARLAALSVVWRNQDLRRLEVAWLAFNIAEYAFVVGLAVFAFRQGGAVAVGVVTLLRTAPALVSGPLAAAYTDRLRRERVLRVSLLARLGAALLIVTVLGFDGAAPLVYLSAALDAVAASLYWPAHSALIPELARSTSELTAGNAAASAVEALGTLLGPLFAALGLAIWEPTAVFVVGAAAFLGGLAAVASLQTDRVAERGPVHPLAEVIEGIRFGLRNREVRLVVGLWTFESFVLGTTEVFVVLVAVELVGLGEPGVGLLSSAVGLGGLFGAIVLSAAPRSFPFGRILALSLAGLGVALVVPGISAVALVAGVAFALTGAAEGFVDVSAQTLLQRLVPERYLARVLGAFEGAYWGSLGIGALAASTLTVMIGLQPALLTIGAGLLVTAAVAFRRLIVVDRSLTYPDDALATLERIPGLDALSVTTLEHLARIATEHGLAAGTSIIRQGDVGDDFYVVASGRVAVAVDGVRVTEIGPGGWFGEIALLRGQPRMADVVALENVSLRVIDGDAFVAAVTGHQRSSDAMGAAMVARLAESGRYRRR